MVTKQLVSAGKRVFNHDQLRKAYLRLNGAEGGDLNTPAEWTAYSLLRVADRMGLKDRLGTIYQAERPLLPADPPPGMVYNPYYLHRKLNRVFDLPDVQVSDWRPPTINVLVPAFDFSSISAGFFGVFQVARFLRETGMHVRLVLFDTFVFSEAEAREKIQKYPGLENLFDELEVEYIGNRHTPLHVSPDDYCVATVWYSAYFAQKIDQAIGRSKFLYLIQDYETNFYPGSSSFALADLTYEMDYDALFSTEALRNLFIQRDIGGFRTRGLRGISFNNACSSKLLDKKEFLEYNTGSVVPEDEIEEFYARNEDLFNRNPHLRNHADHMVNTWPKKKRKLVFYSRPVVDRNMFELTALAICEAYRQGIFNPEDWDCIGMGLGEGIIEVLPGVASAKLPRMALDEYMNIVAEFDVCLTLMASPHPSMIPMDLAGSGAIVVTNTFATKTPEYLTSLNKNIIPVSPDLPSIVEGLREAVERSTDLESRYQNAAEMTYPRSWSETFTPEHVDFVKQWTSEV